MEILIIAIVAFLCALLTFFSGFGLGTILTPVFAFFFPIDLAIVLTGIVHFLNNIFKFILIGRFARRMVVFWFGIPAIFTAFVGASLLLRISAIPPIMKYSLRGSDYEVTTVNIIIALLLIVFAVLEVYPFMKGFIASKRMLALGGTLSGFFGGLSGHQGALRSAFLLQFGLSKEVFIGTGVVIAIFIDLSRLSVYATRYAGADLKQHLWLIVAGTMSAFAGALIGRQLLKKITIDAIQKIVAILLVLISIALGAGWI